MSSNSSGLPFLEFEKQYFQDKSATIIPISISWYATLILHKLILTTLTFAFKYFFKLIIHLYPLFVSLSSKTIRQEHLVYIEERLLDTIVPEF
jgi:hypothetical protein